MRKLLSQLEVAPENHRLLGIINYALFTSGIATALLGVILPYIKAENALSYTQSGLMLSAHQVGNLCAVLLVGVLPFILGRKKSTLLLGAGTSIGLILAVITHNPMLLIAAFALTGAGRGAWSNTCNFVVGDISGNRTSALNVLHSIFATGALFAPVIVFLFVSFAGNSGWKTASLTVALSSIIACALVFLSKLPSTPEQKEKDKSGAIMRSTGFWFSTSIFFFYLATEASITGWFVLYFVDEGILPEGLARFAPTMYWVPVMVGRLSTAIISKHVHNKNKLLLVMAISATVCFIGMFLSGSTVSCVLFLLGIGLSMAGIYPTAIATMNGVDSSVSLGFAISIATLGSIFMPGIIGAVADTHGLTNGIATLLAALLGMVALILLKLINDSKC